MPRLKPRRAEPLAARTTSGVGGPATWFVSVSTTDELVAALQWAEARSLATWIIGGGSNVVIADQGLQGLVIDVAIGGLHVNRIDAQSVEVTVGAGCPWDPFVAHCVARGWAGVECLSGIPGRVGATPIQNVGAYGQEVAQTLVSVQVYDRRAQRLATLAAESCGFGYRSSCFKLADHDPRVVVAATFRLQVDGAPTVRYPDLKRRLSPLKQPSLTELRQAVLAARREKSMLLDPSDENSRSCGSFFLNPALSQPAFDALSERLDPPVPQHLLPNGLLKVPAAWLIERAGFARGQRFGNVGISSRHALALVCHRGATAAEFVALARRVRDRVAAQLGVELTPEPRFLGFQLDASGMPQPEPERADS